MTVHLQYTVLIGPQLNGQTSTSMNTLSFKILPSEESRDHEVRILIDGNDILGKDHLGIDPPEFFGQQHLMISGQIVIGRCCCGVVGCDDYSVTVNVFEDKISWTTTNGLYLEFDRSACLKALSDARTDQSWENKERRVERLTSDVLRNTSTINDYQFDWTSARIEEKLITVSYSKDRQQKLFKFDWDGQTEQSAVNGAHRFLMGEEIKNVR